MRKANGDFRPGGTQWDTRQIELVLDCAEPKRLGKFSRAALYYREYYSDATLTVLVPSEGIGSPLLLDRVPEPKARKNRMHLDIVVDDVEAEVDRLYALGARRIDDGVQSFGGPDGSECRTLSRTSSASPPAWSGSSTPSSGTSITKRRVGDVAWRQSTPAATFPAEPTTSTFPGTSAHAPVSRQCDRASNPVCRMPHGSSFLEWKPCGDAISGHRQFGERQSPPRDTSCAAITLRWISLVPSPTIISGASRKYRSTSYSVEYP